MTTYTFHSDAGHSWLKVSIDELKRLKLMDKISSYSYRKGNYAYLEEDSDASQFVGMKNALKEKFKYNEKYDGGSSPIRNYPAFDTLMGYKPDNYTLKGKGWKSESARHALARKGIKTGRKTKPKKITLKTKPNIVINQPKLKGQEDSFFYDGTIASTKAKDGTEFWVSATGDIRIFIGEDEYRNQKGAYEATAEHKLTDKKLKELEGKGKLVWENNNWFSVSWQKAGTDYADTYMGDTPSDYDNAVKLLKEVKDRYERTGVI